MTIIDLPDEAATAALAAAIAGVARVGDVIALGGGLGAGKTAFARAFIGARGGGADVPSPTFTLVQAYELPAATIWHFDCYRLRDAEEAWELGIEEAFHDGIALIEWPERIAPLLPVRRLTIELMPGPTPDSRRARLDGGGDWPARLRQLGLDG